MSNSVWSKYSCLSECPILEVLEQRLWSALIGPHFRGVVCPCSLTLHGLTNGEPDLGVPGLSTNQHWWHTCHLTDTSCIRTWHMVCEYFPGTYHVSSVMYRTVNQCVEKYVINQLSFIIQSVFLNSSLTSITHRYIVPLIHDHDESEMSQWITIFVI